MTLNKFVFKTHKWLAVGVGVLTVVWFGSGVVIVLPAGVLRGAAAANAPGSETAGFREVSLSVPQAIAAAETAAGGPITVTGISLRNIAGHMVYQISTVKSGTHHINAKTGERFEINEEVARSMIAQRLGGRAEIGEVSLQKEHNLEYGYGPLPVYRVAVKDREATVYQVEKDTGEMHASNRNDRIRAFNHALHNLSILNLVLPKKVVHLLLILTGFVGTIMSLFGMWILWIQWKVWLAGRQARAA